MTQTFTIQVQDNNSCIDSEAVPKFYVGDEMVSGNINYEIAPGDLVITVKATNDGNCNFGSSLTIGGASITSEPYNAWFTYTPE